MLNINQNFDLKAPVFNFDRDYFNSIEELNAYDVSNVPDHFVTNVAGMLYLFTDGKWLPMILTVLEDGDANPPVQWLKLCGNGCLVFADFEGNQYSYDAYGDNSSAKLNSNGTIELDYSKDLTGGPNILLSGRNSENNSKDVNIGMIRNDAFGLDINGRKEDIITICIDKKLTDLEQADGYSQVDMSLTDGDNNADINAINGFTHKTEDGWTSNFNGYGLDIKNGDTYSSISDNKVALYTNNRDAIVLMAFADETVMYIGGDEGFKISRPIDNTEGATITGVKSLAAFSNPSATKVWATDGSTVDLATKADASALDAKANASDVLLKKSASGGYYIESNSNELGNKAFAINDSCTASGYCGYSEGVDTTASGEASHAEGYQSVASGLRSHAEGFITKAQSEASHAEGYKTLTNGVGAHAEGFMTLSTEAYSHAEGNGTVASGPSSHTEGVKSKALAEGAHAEGNSISRGLFSHAENKGIANGDFSHAEGSSSVTGEYSHAEGSGCRTSDNLMGVTKSGSCCHVEGIGTICISKGGHTEGNGTYVAGDFAHAEGIFSRADGTAAHAEGENTIANGDSAHAQGRFNVGNKYYIHSVGIGNQNQRKNAECIYMNADNMADSKNGYMYIYGIGGYDGISTNNTIYKSVQEVIADLTARIEQLETKVRVLEAANTPA